MSLLKRPPTLKMAPPGSHVVKKQARVSKNGIKYFVKAHLRKNENAREFSNRSDASYEHNQDRPQWEIRRLANESKKQLPRP